MITYDPPVFRPPSEGDNLILQATLGCSYNHCTFCGMYKSKVFQARPVETVLAEAARVAARYAGVRRIFLADGDALALPADHLLALLTGLAGLFPDLQRVTCYATPFNLLKKTETELESLRAAKLSLVYLGIESGSDAVLKRIAKGNGRQIREATLKARAAGIKVSATVILGLGGKTLWQEHVEATAELINAAPPTYLSTLQLTLEESTMPAFLARFPEFEPQDDSGVLVEQRRLIEKLSPPEPVIFRSNHASNCLPLAGNLPKDRDKLLAQIDAAMTDDERLRPWFLRGL